MKSQWYRNPVRFIILAALCAALFAQTQNSNSKSSQTQSPDQIPDAPSAVKPPSPFPAGTAPASKSGNQSPADSASSPDQPIPPPANVTTAPPGTNPPGVDKNSRQEFTIPVIINMVIVPVTVKDTTGHLVPGLVRQDFAILENNQPQQIKLFTSDPFPLSAAVVLDSNLPSATIKKVDETLPALTGAFSEFDEVGLFTYGNTVQQRMAFNSSSQQLAIAVRRSKIEGRQGGPPIDSGPLYGGPTPTVNSHPYDPGAPRVNTVRKESSVLNDAILAAATDLAKRDRSRRKIIFVISDGAESGSAASYSDVLKVLLSNEISVYAVAVDASAIPGYSDVNKLHIPGFAYGNILGKYVGATGGEVFAEFTRDAIEAAYARLTEEARNQYTLGYTTHGTAAGDYRRIEVLVHRPGLEVHAKDGYYPLPPAPPRPTSTP